MRKIIQLVAAGAGKTDRSALAALCDDGTVWLATGDVTRPWVFLGAIPQGEV